MGERQVIIICVLLCFGVGTAEYLAKTSSTPESEEKKVVQPGDYVKDIRKKFNSLELPTSTTKMQPCDGHCSSPPPIPPMPAKRKKRIVAKHPSEEIGATTFISIHSQAVLSPFPTLDPLREKKKINKIQRKLNKGNRSNKLTVVKKINSMMGSDDDKDKMDATSDGTDRKSRKKMIQLKKLQPPVREGQTPRRLRQHMQHKKKVKHFLQKRIQEQIEQRSQKQESKI